VREGDPVQLAPAVVVLVGRPAEGRGEGRTCGQGERVLDAREDEEVARGLGGGDAWDGEEVEAGGADAVRGREAVEQVAQRDQRSVA
jgi:hypothetical protein